MKIVIVDYGMGNIRSIASTLRYLGVDDVVLSDDYEIMNSGDKIILPGVGSFGKAMAEIRKKQIDQYLSQIVVEGRKPLLGICLGMQLLCNSSTEDGFNKGLAFINAEVTKFEEENLKIPHVGFNQVIKNLDSKLFKDINNNADFYFTHSYKVSSTENINQSMCNYGQNFIATFEVENIYATQFHPELSQNNGLQLLKNFLKES